MSRKHAYLTDLLNTGHGPEFEAFLASETIRKQIQRFEDALVSDWHDFKRAQAGPPPPSIRRLEMPVFDKSKPAPLPAPAAAQTVPPQPAPRPAPAPAMTAPKPPSNPTKPALPIDGQGLPPPATDPRLAPMPHPVFRLPNARQGEAYDAAVQIEGGSGRAHIRFVKVPESTGLRYETQGNRIVGTPTVHGDVLLPIIYRYGTDIPEAKRTSEARLYVNPDPRSLWKTLASDETDPLWKPDEAHQGLDSIGRKIVAARKRGRSHAHAGTCCDDDFALACVGEWSIAIVADGAGSAKASRRGSQLAVSTALQHLESHLAGEGGQRIEQCAAELASAASDSARSALHAALYMAVGHAAHRAVRALHDEVAKWPDDAVGSVRDLATTLLVGISRPVGDQWLCAAYWVGDGAVGVYRAGEDVTLLGEVDAGEFSGQTKFLDASEVTGEALMARTRFSLTPDYSAMILMTDGVSDPKFETEARLAQLPAWDALWADLGAESWEGLAPDSVAAGLLDWLDFWSQGNHDDRTIAVIY